MFPSEPFRDERPVEKITAIKAGKDDIEKFLLEKIKRKHSSAVCCKCLQGTAVTASTKHKAYGGKAITEDSFING